MNIFILDENPRLAARYLGNGHISKMVLESVQLMSSVYYFLDKEKALRYYADGRIYKLTHENHPCAVWVRESVENFKWLWSYTYYLELERMKIKEYKGQEYRQHKAIDTMLNFPELPNRNSKFFKTEQTPFAMAVGEENREKFKNNPIGGYRYYYITQKQKQAVYEGRKVPNWFVNL